MGNSLFPLSIGLVRVVLVPVVIDKSRHKSKQGTGGGKNDCMETSYFMKCMGQVYRNI